MNDVRIGIVGIGNMGFAHANCIYNGTIKGLRLAAVCDIDVNKQKRAANAFPALPIFFDYNEMLHSKQLDAVLIAVPHNLHSKIATAAFEAGLHVLVEKPADVSISAVRKMNATAENSGKVFGIMFNQRTNPIFRKAREIVQSGRLGVLKRSVWIITNWYRKQSYYDSGSWRATWAGEGGGVLINQAPHNLDLWQWICGMPSSVTAFCDTAKYHNIEVEDNVSIFTRYPNGAVGTFLTSTGEYPGTNRLEITGTLGKLVVEDGKLKLWALSMDERELCYNDSVSLEQVSVSYREDIPNEIETSHPGILQNFTDCIQYGTPLIADGREGIHSLTLSNAAYLSEWNNHQEVLLPFCEEEFDLLLQQHRKDSSFHKGESCEPTGNAYKKRWQVNW